MSSERWTKPLAAVLPHNRKLIVWVTSPRGHWMLLAGHWSVASEARRYARAAGYELTSAREALASIELQMAARMDNLASPTAVDVTREDNEVVDLAAYGKKEVH